MKPAAEIRAALLRTFRKGGAGNQTPRPHAFAFIPRAAGKALPDLQASLRQPSRLPSFPKLTGGLLLASTVLTLPVHLKRTKSTYGDLERKRHSDYSFQNSSSLAIASRHPWPKACPDR